MVDPDSASATKRTPPPPLDDGACTSVPPTTSAAPKRSESNMPTSLLVNVVIPLALLAVGAGVVLAWGSVKPKARPDADNTRAGRMQALAPVRVQRLQSLATTGRQLQLEVDGTVVPFREAVVAAEVAGRIVFKAEGCEAGAIVQKGQLLMRIDDTDYELEVDRLTRQKEQEYQALQELDQELANNNRLLSLAKEDVELQEAELKRQESLPSGFSSRGEIDQAKRGLLQATQQLVSSQNALDLLKKRRVRLEASEKLAATQLKSAKLNLARTTIKAPIDGVIVREDADLNTFVSRGSALVTIEDTSKAEVATNLRMDQLYWVLDQVEQKEAGRGGYLLPETPAIIEYQLSGRGNQVYRWEGRLLSYDGIGLDPNTRTVPVRVVVDNPQKVLNAKNGSTTITGPAALLRGMFVRVKLLIEPKTALVVIPGVALKPGNRVWQFVPDESVLGQAESADTTIQNASATNSDRVAATNVSADDSANPSEATDEPMIPDPNVSSDDAKVADEQESEDDLELQESAFDPDDWVPGRVVVLQEVYPVDSMSVSGGQAGKAVGSDPRPETRMWVCEVSDKSFSDGSFVVTSPLGSIPPDGLPARAAKKSIQSIPAKATLPDHPSVDNNDVVSPERGDAA
ncbi:MAG: HlyD family efflux transporter periplasmic adaptor subunit [Pirellulaceae bacterium]|nr:HlyD family efflux transporter periplasmic adaptor subunit [Pirellulaceae bacterium]